MTNITQLQDLRQGHGIEVKDHDRALEAANDQHYPTSRPEARTHGIEVKDQDRALRAANDQHYPTSRPEAKTRHRGQGPGLSIQSCQ